MLFRYRYDTETGLYYLQSRYYNPEWGRFINADGFVGKPGELLAHNMFAYCKNNPVNMSDPSGFMPTWAKWAIGAAVVVAVVAIIVLAPEVAVLAAELGEEAIAAGAAAGLAAEESLQAVEEAAPKVEQTGEELVAKGLEYGEHVVKRMSEDKGIFHNFPKLLDNEIVSGSPNIARPDGRLEFIKRGTMDIFDKVKNETKSMEGVYHITVKGNEMIHRCFFKILDWDSRFSQNYGLPLYKDIN